jgi:hypothetical protein
MNTLFLSPEQIEQNWHKFLKMCKHVGEHRVERVLEMCDKLGERFALAPASSRLEHHCAWPGGLVDHSLRVLVNASAMSKSLNVQVPKESLVISCLFHDAGKIGFEQSDTDYYLPQDSDWHREKLGEMYKVNNKIQFMTVPHRSLYLLQAFEIKLSVDEYVAIMIHDGFGLDENRKYMLKEPNLATIVSHADYIATQQEKDLQANLKPQEPPSDE